MNPFHGDDASPPLPDFLPTDAFGDDRAGHDHDATGVIRPLPVPVPLPLPVPRPLPLPLRSVRCGCWLLSLRPVGSPLVAYDGTLRVECHSGGRTASGDLYQRRLIVVRDPLPLPRPGPGSGPIVRPPVSVLGPAPTPAAGIPILPRGRYRYYLRVTSLPETFYVGSSFNLGFELWRFTAPNSWALEGARTAVMTRTSAPSGYPSPNDYAEGDVKNAAGAVVARLTMGWISKHFRRASIEIDTVAGSERPTHSGAGHTWATVMEELGWQVDVMLGDTNVAEPSGAGWSNAEMHAAMLARRAAVDLDAEWRYHVLAVKTIDSTPRGIMYDSAGTDSNNVPREGIGIASHWTIEPGWGLVSGQRFGTAAAPYFRTAVHEVGHAMGLFHTTGDFGFMNTSDVIAAGGTPANPFPNNIKWGYHPDNLKQLRHHPDPFVRPGSVAFGGASTTNPPIAPTDMTLDMSGLTLEVAPLLAEVPLGAPVRVGYRLINTGTEPAVVPKDLTFLGEAMSGTVTDPGGRRRGFSTVVSMVDDAPFVVLEPGESMAESATLLRGSDGALFPIAGVHEIEVELHWESGEAIAGVRGTTTVMVTPATDAQHAAAAHRVLATPDVHLVLAIGGDHLADGIDAIHAALGSKALRPHYALIEAKRVGRRFGKRKPDVKGAAALIDDDTVMSGSEIGSMARAVTAGGTPAKELVKTLKSRAKGHVLPQAAQEALDAL